MSNYFKDEKSGLRFKFEDVLISYNTTAVTPPSKYSNIQVIDNRTFLVIKLRDGSEYRLYYDADNKADRFLKEFDKWCEREP